MTLEAADGLSSYTTPEVMFYLKQKIFKSFLEAVWAKLKDRLRISYETKEELTYHIT